jgi:hypothetical protein
MASTPKSRDSWRSDVDPIQLAAILGGTIVLASVIGVEVGLSVALIELGLGVHIVRSSWCAEAAIE